MIILLLASYTTNSAFRKFVDNKIFHKEVTENSLATIEINSDDNPISFAYSNLIGVYSKNNLNIYTQNSDLSEKILNTANIETNVRVEKLDIQTLLNLSDIVSDIMG